MRAIFGLVLIVGLALAGGAVYMAKSYIGGYQAKLAEANSSQTQSVETVDVLVATRVLKYGEPLTAKDIRMVKWPKGAVPEGIFQKAEFLIPDADTPSKRRIVLRQIEPNEAILSIKVTEPGEDAGLTSRLERGMRAFAIKVDVTSGVSGFLRPGDRVDVYWTGETPGALVGSRREFTKLIESSVQLIAVDQTANDQKTEAVIARTITVAVTPTQVASLAQAQSSGSLSLSLVGAKDDTISAAIEIDQRDLLGILEPEPAPVVQAEVAPKVCSIRTRKGAEVVVIPIPCTN